jgi:hypothetical protein
MFFKEEIATSSQPAYVGIAMMVASDDLINCCRSNAIFSFLFFSFRQARSNIKKMRNLPLKSTH